MNKMDIEQQLEALKRRLDIQSAEIKKLEEEKKVLKSIAQTSQNEAIMSNSLKQSTDSVMTTELTKLNRQVQDLGQLVQEYKNRLKKYEDVD